VTDRELLEEANALAGPGEPPGGATPHDPTTDDDDIRCSFAHLISHCTPNLQMMRYAP
jgi:hypothetical protein